MMIMIMITSTIRMLTFWEYPRSLPYEQIKKNIIQVTSWPILETTIGHLDTWTDKIQKPKQGAKLAKSSIYQVPFNELHISLTALKFDFVKVAAH